MQGVESGGSPAVESRASGVDTSMKCVGWKCSFSFVLVIGAILLGALPLSAQQAPAPITRTKLKLHFHPTHFIDVSTPLALDSTAGDPPLSTPCIIRKRAYGNRLKFSFPRFVFLMQRFH